MTKPAIPTATFPQGPLAPMPINPDWITEGTPTARGSVLLQSQDQLLSAGWWECTAGKFQWIFGWDEFVHIIEGEVTIREEGGATHTLKPGDTAHFPLGLKTYWHVPVYVKKFFTLRTPEPFHL